MATKKSAPTKNGGALPFENYNTLLVPITPLRMELSQLRNSYGLDTIPLGELLRIIARVMKENKDGNV